MKFTYTAQITLPDPDLICVMSAVASQPRRDNTFFFSQPVAIPSYLFAIAVGRLTSRAIGPRSSVYAEPAMIDACVDEFAESTEKYLAIAESICGRYEWSDRYDFLVLPPSFPYGGMENPNITFVTPTLLAGDKSLTDVIAHEITHSWTGNLVGCVDWQHFWLNEGFTRFIECKIIAAFHGNNESVRHLSMINGYASLCTAVSNYGNDHPYTKLVLHFTAEDDPDDAFSSVPYEKGCLFLYYIETIVGKTEFDSFLKGYIAKFKHKAISTSDFKEFLYYFFHSQKEKLDRIDWEGWLNSPGVLPVTFESLKIDDSLQLAALHLAEDVCGINKMVLAQSPDSAGDAKIESQADSLKKKYAPMTTVQRVIFLQTLRNHKDTLHQKTLSLLDRVLEFSRSKNSEIVSQWVLIALSCKDYDQIIRPQVTRFLSSNGRMKYVRPVFRAFFQVDPEAATSLFLSLRHTLHPICETMLAKDLQIKK